MSACALPDRLPDRVLTGPEPTRARYPDDEGYVTDHNRGSDEIERLIRTARFEPMNIGGIKQSGRLEVGGDLHDLVVGPAEARSLIARP